MSCSQNRRLTFSPHPNKSGMVGIKPTMLTSALACRFFSSYTPITKGQVGFEPTTQGVPFSLPSELLTYVHVVYSNRQKSFLSVIGQMGVEPTLPRFLGPPHYHCATVRLLVHSCDFLNFRLCSIKYMRRAETAVYPRPIMGYFHCSQEPPTFVGG